MLKSRWMYILLILLLPAMVVADIFSSASKSFQLLDGGEPATPVQGRGRWSSGSEDYRIDLAGDWNAVREDGVEIGAVNVPFIWDGWSGELTLSSKFYLPDTLINRTYRLVIVGASGSITIMLNGAHLDTRFGNELSYQLEINPRLFRFGTDNELQLILDNRLPRRRGIPLNGGIYTQRYYGGLDQDIYLKCSPVTSIEDVVASWEGDNLSETGSVRVETILHHSGYSSLQQEGNNFTVEYSLLDPTGNVLAGSLQENLQFPPGGILNLNEVMELNSNNYWTTINSNSLYQVRVRLTGNAIDYSSSALFAVKNWRIEENGFLLNGEQIWLRCISYASLRNENGDLLDDDELEADIVMLKELGADAVRIMQRSVPMYFLDLCDKYGLLVFEELPIYQIPDALLSEPDLIRSATEQFEAMILRDRRFACIAGWGIGSLINPMNHVNAEYYQKLIEIARRLDNRPIYASFRYMDEFTAAPLDFVILEITPGSKQDFTEHTKAAIGDKPFLLGGIRQLVLPGNLNGYVDNESEAGQADHILNSIRWAESLKGCTGVIAGDYCDWAGALPTIAGPLHGESLLYTSGLTDAGRNPHLAWHHLKEYWASGRIQPLPSGELKVQDGVILIILGIGLIILLFVATRQNNIFRINLARTFTSTKGFFQDISDRRYFQTSHTFLIAILISGSLALIMSGWVFANRRLYAVDWSLAYLISDSELLKWIGSIVWMPSRSLIFFWGLLFFLLWLASVRIMILCSLLGRPCSLSQSFSFINWSMAGFLITLPLAVIAVRLFAASMGWVIISIVLLVVIWSHFRLITVITQHTRRGIGKVVVFWFIGPIIFAVAFIFFLEYTRHISDYWNFFRGSILP